MKKVIYTLLVLSMLFLSAWNTSSNRTYTLQVDNKTEESVYLHLRGSRFYYLYVPAGELREYRVVGDVYQHITHFCNTNVGGEFQLGKSMRLVFPSCKEAPNRGEGKHSEKVYPGFENKLNWTYKDSDFTRDFD